MGHWEAWVCSAFVIHLPLGVSRYSLGLLGMGASRGPVESTPHPPWQPGWGEGIPGFSLGEGRTYLELQGYETVILTGGSFVIQGHLAVSRGLSGCPPESRMEQAEVRGAASILHAQGSPSQYGTIQPQTALLPRPRSLEVEGKDVVPLSCSLPTFAG